MSDSTDLRRATRTNFGRILQGAALGGILVAALAASAWFVLLRPPSSADRHAWLMQAIDALIDPQLLGATKAQAGARFPGALPGRFLQGWELRFREVFRQPEKGEFLSTARLTFQPDQGITAEQVVALLQGRWGEPRIDRMLNRDRTWYFWKPTPGLSASVTGPSPSSDGSGVSVQVDHDPGTLATVPTPAEATAWLDGFADLIGGPGLRDANVADVLAQFPPLQGRTTDGQPCPDDYQAGVVSLSPLLHSVGMHMTDGAAGRCADRKLRVASFLVWKVRSISAEMLLDRLVQRLGPAQVRVTDGRDERTYAWALADRDLAISDHTMERYDEFQVDLRMKR